MYHETTHAGVDLKEVDVIFLKECFFWPSIETFFAFLKISVSKLSLRFSLQKYLTSDVMRICIKRQYKKLHVHLKNDNSRQKYKINC